jgi:hypothetical protein
MALFAGLELKVFNAASLSGSFQNLGAVLANPCYQAVLSNESDVGVIITTDGSTSQIQLSPGQILPLSYYSRHNTLTEGAYVLKKGTQLQIKQVTAAGTGSIIVNILTTR